MFNLSLFLLQGFIVASESEQLFQEASNPRKEQNPLKYTTITGSDMYSKDTSLK